MTWKVRLSGPAQRDFHGVIRWTRGQFGPRQALRYDALLRHALRSLQDGPDALGSRGRDDLLFGLRTLHVARVGHKGSHLLAHVARSGRRIEVLRILHEQMDLARHLGIDGGGTIP